MTDTPRIPLLFPTDWDGAARAAFAIMDSSATRDVGAASNMAMTLAHHPPLAAAYYTLGKYLALDSTLSPRMREVVTLRVAWLLKSDYEWCHHVRFAKAIGISDEEIEAIRLGTDAGVWPAQEQCLLKLVDELHGRRAVTDSTWHELNRHLSRQQVMDLVFTVGHYIATALVLSAFRIHIEKGFDRPDHPLYTGD